VETDPALVSRLRAAGCVWAEDEAALLTAAAASAAELDRLASRRAAGEPLEAVLGWADFCGLRVAVDPGVFVPRRRSEYLVAVALREISAPVTADPLVITDLCCGTGALGLAVAAALGPPGLAGLHAADLAPAAVACARRNIEPRGGRVYAGDLFAALPESLRGRVDVLICNAPYVPTAQIAFLPAEAREHEDPLALDGGADGLAVLRRAAAGAPGWLAPGGLLLTETSERQAAAMAATMAAAGLTARVHEDDESGATVVTGVREGRPDGGKPH